MPSFPTPQAFPPPPDPFYQLCTSVFWVYSASASFTSGLLGLITIILPLTSGPCPMCSASNWSCSDPSGVGIFSPECILDAVLASISCFPIFLAFYTLETIHLTPSFRLLAYFSPPYSLGILQDLVFLHVVSLLELRTTDTPC